MSITFTAWDQACPAWSLGSLPDEGAAVQAAKIKGHPHHYGSLIGGYEKAGRFGTCQPSYEPTQFYSSLPHVVEMTTNATNIRPSKNMPSSSLPACR